MQQNDRRDVNERWRAVVNLWLTSRSAIRDAATQPGAINSVIFIRNVPYNLAFILACGALESALAALWRQGRFTCKTTRPMLKTLMGDSRQALPWLEYDLVDKGRERRNELAHQGEVLQKEECEKYVRAIESELLKWGGLVQDHLLPSPEATRRSHGTLTVETAKKPPDP